MYMVTSSVKCVMVIIPHAVAEKHIMSRASRQKGQRGEREICKLLAEKLGGEYKRNLMQTQEGGYDVLGLDGYAIEVKFQEKLQIEKWWEQTVQQASVERLPVLFFRRSREPWRVVVPHDYWYTKNNRVFPVEKRSTIYYSVIPVDDFMEQVNEDTRPKTKT